MQETRLLKDKLEEIERFDKDFEEIELLIELGNEDEDNSLLDEVKDSLVRVERKLERFRISLLLKGQYDKNNALIALHAGAGGTEAQDWVEMLLRMYTRWAENKGFKVKILDILDGDEAGIKSVTFMLEGINAYGFAKAENGVHRLVRISPFDSSGRRHTSFASVEVMPEIDEDIEIDIDPQDLRVDTFRASGAGGQHINKTDSAIRITHLPTGVVVACQTERSQFQNKETAMKMLRSKLYELKEREHKEKIEDLKGIHLKIEWGSQIRSYVFCPYTLVKDHRTDHEETNVQKVMDGEIDNFIFAYLNKER
jgi:peptide chain release factor 2